MSKNNNYKPIFENFSPEVWQEVQNIFDVIENKCFYKRNGDFDFPSFFEETLKAYTFKEKIIILKAVEMSDNNWKETLSHQILKSYISFLEKQPAPPTPQPKSMPLVNGKKQTAVAQLIEAYYLSEAGEFDFNSEKAFKERFGNASAYNQKKEEKHKSRLETDYLPLTKWVADYCLSGNAKKIALQDIENKKK